VQRDIALSRIAREVPEGAQAYNNFENKIKEIYNNVLLQTVKNKSNKSETDELKNKKTISLFTIKELADSGETITLEKDKNGNSTGYLLITKSSDPTGIKRVQGINVIDDSPSRVSVREFLKLRLRGEDPFEIVKGQSSDNTNSSTGTPAPKRSMK
jgi:hypothetical protein